MPVKHTLCVERGCCNTKRSCWESIYSYWGQTCRHSQQTGVGHVEEVSEEGKQSVERKEVW